MAREPSNPLLAGLPDALPLEPMLELPGLLPGRREERSQRARPRPLAEGPVPKAQAAGSGVSWRRVAYAVLYVLVLALAGAGFVLPPEPSAVPAGQPTLEFVRFVERVVPGQRVLLAVDYGLGGAGELDPLVRAAVGHLGMRRAELVTVTTRPEGVGLGAQLRRSFGGPTADLGYLPGEPHGAALAAAGAAEADLLLVATDSPLALQAWVEQLQARQGLPAAALLSRALEPQARAYRQAGQLQAVLSGLQGAAEYETLLGWQGPGQRGLDSLMALSVLLVAAILAGNLEELTRRRGSGR